MVNRYEKIMDEYRKSLKNFEVLTDIDAHEKRFKEKAKSALINEAIYLMFTEGVSLANQYLKNNGNDLDLLKENIQSLEGKLVHRYDDDPKTKAMKIYPVGSAYDVLEDAHTAFYRGAEYHIKNPQKHFNKNDFFTLMAREKRLI